ncbi:MAG: universal stress protein [Planctomycetota bacterium]
MLRSILVGLDGSEYSQSAVELAIRWAKKYNCLLAAIGVVDEPNIRAGDAVPLGGSYFQQRKEEFHFKHARAQVEHFLDRFAKECTQAGVSYKLLEEVGSPYEQIDQEAQRYDLIFLGQHTNFSFETQATACETLFSVLKDSPRPVVTVPIRLGAEGPILIAYDESLQAARTLQAFVGLGLDTSAGVHVASIHSDHVEAARRAHRAIEYLMAHDIKATAKSIPTDGNVADVLLKQADEMRAGMIVLGAFGQPRWREFFFGSATQDILKRSQVPLFLYH